VSETDRACGLRFESVPGPLVAVCGAAGGVGVSTIATALARQAARESPLPILVAEVDSGPGGLAAVVGAQSGQSLAALARDLAAGTDHPAIPWIEPEPGLRVIAGRPGLGAPLDAVPVLVQQARMAHALVALDCGVAGSEAARVGLAAADHTLLVLRDSEAAVTRAELVAGSLRGQCGLTVVLIAGRRERGVRRRARLLAERQADGLVLVPSARAGHEDDLLGALAGLAVALRTRIG
jgi:MinD-like ATPase involved in chromosome partitioning or flagellar assembly